MSAKDKILKLLQDSVGKVVPRSDIVRVAGISEWARRIRELTAAGWQIETTGTGYRLASLEKGTATDLEPISAKLRYRVLHRDGSKCRRCGRTIEDGVKLVIDHIIPRAWGGLTEIENLWTLCEECNLGKKHHESDVNAEAMKRVLGQTSGRARILEYFKLKVGEVVTKAELQIIAGIGDYPRRIRELRDDGWDIVSMYEEPTLAPGDYILRSLVRRT